MIKKSVIGWAIEEDDFNEVTEKIVKLCNLQNVTNRLIPAWLVTFCVYGLWWIENHRTIVKNRSK